MEERHYSQLIQNLIDRFNHLGAEIFNLEKELELTFHPITREPLDKEVLAKIKKELLERIHYKESHDGAILVPVSVVSDPKLHEEWYGTWLSDNNDRVGSYYWKRLEEFLSVELTRKIGAKAAGHVVKSIDEATASIMEKLANPLRREFTYKGLVVGYVQSGKTANFTALISKAVDAGYKLIIVLSGIHSVLRRQTQIRLDKELTGMNDLHINEAFIQEPSDVKRWNRITTAHVKRRHSRDGQLKIRDLGEFDIVNVDPFNSLCNRSTPTLAIIKKNVRVLDRLIEYIRNSDSESRSNIPVLIIDDEADQASVDTNANNPDADPISTNDRIRTVLGLFPRRAYVGYTATPFANVLIDMTTEHAALLDDLYPRNFIVSLPEPEGYFGTRRIFQGDLAELFSVEVSNDEGEEEISLLTGQITEHLTCAIDQFILSCAVRNLRGDKVRPMSMLVHVTHVITHMKTIHEIITSYIEDISGRYIDRKSSQSLKEEFKTVWRPFADKAAAINHELNLVDKNKIPAFDEVWAEMKNVFVVLRAMELNSSSEDRLDYNTEEEMKIIAVGGNQLSRGLTLEGLMTSYYLRDSRQYDTLLQMGRWFGYRHRYEDLTRIHTTTQIWELFEHLALVEEELRGEIYRYEEENLTPLQMALAIRSHRNMAITAPKKMGAGRVKQLSFSGSLNQTHWLPLDQPDILQQNYNLGNSFISKINSDSGFANARGNGVFLAKKKISGQIVLAEFLKKYQVVDTNRTGGPGLDYISLLQYISRRLNDQSPELTRWSVGVVSNINPGSESTPTVYGGLSVNKISRSRKYTPIGYNIGVLTEPNHLDVDLDLDEIRDPQNPLLLFYLISKESKAKGEHKQAPKPQQRIDLFQFIDTKKIDVLGIAILLPFSEFEDDHYIGQ
jgi:hypothetical protein